MNEDAKKIIIFIHDKNNHRLKVMVGFQALLFSPVCTQDSINSFIEHTF